MPVIGERISEFYGLVVTMYLESPDSELNATPHVHVFCSDCHASYGIQDRIVLSGAIPSTAQKLMNDWTSVHETELMLNWFGMIDKKMPNKVIGLA